MAWMSSGEQRLTSNSLISGFKKEIFSLARLRWNEKREDSPGHELKALDGVSMPPVVC